MFEDTKGIGKLKNYIQYNGQRKGIKGQIIIHKTLHRKQKIGQYEPTENREWTQVVWKGKHELLHKYVNHQ